MTKEKPQNQFQDAVDFTTSTLGKDLMAALLQEIRALPDVWQKMNEARQNEVIERIRTNMENATYKAVSIIASQGCKRVLGELEKVTLAEKNQAVVVLNKSNNSDDLIELLMSVKEPVMIVLSSPSQFTGGMDEIKGEPDQRDIFPQAEQEVKGGTVARIGRDKKDK